MQLTGDFSHLKMLCEHEVSVGGQNEINLRLKKISSYLILFL